MQYTVEDISPVKKSVAVTVPAEEVDAIITRITAQYRSRVALPGFRKGKAPMGMIEKRFTQDIYGDAANELVNGNISEILREKDLEPMGQLSFEGDNEPLKKGEAFTYTFSFEVAPEIAIPEYEGIGVEEDEVKVEDSEIEEVFDRARRGMAERLPVEDKRLAGDGDVVIMDFAGYDENGEAVEGVSGENFQVAIGDKQVIPDFEALAKTVMPGESGEGKVTFPEDYGHAPLAGKTVDMKITVNSLMTRKLPEMDDDFAKKAGGFDSVDAMRDSIRETYTQRRKEFVKAKAQRQLIEKLLEKTDFPLPEGIVGQYTQNIMHGRLEEMARNGGDLAAFDEDGFAKLQEEAKAEAEKYARTQLFLLAVAKKEGLEVTPQEMTADLRRMAAAQGRDIKEMQKHYMENNLLPALRERILADKAMDAIYTKAATADKAEGAEEPAKTKEAAEPGLSGSEASVE